MWILIQSIVIPLVLSVLSVPILQELNGDNTTIEEQLESYSKNEITESEENGIKQLRELASDVLLHNYERSEYFLVRWLRECQLEVNCANNMIRKAHNWRVENEMDSISNKTFLPEKYHSCFLSGSDKQGGPVLIYKVMGVDLRRLITGGQFENMIHHSDQCVEKYIHKSIIRSPTTSKITDMIAGITLVDAQGYTIKQHGCYGCIEFYRQIAAHSNQYFPQSSKLVVIINAPPIAKPAIELVKPFLSPFFKKTLRVFGSSKQEWSSYLLSVIPKEELLEEYGGTKKADLLGE